MDSIVNVAVMSQIEKPSETPSLFYKYETSACKEKVVNIRNLYSSTTFVGLMHAEGSIHIIT